jgi:hypothetical protein
LETQVAIVLLFSQRGRLKKDDREPKNRMLKAKKKEKQEQTRKRDDIANVCVGLWGRGHGGEEDIMEVLN